MEADLMVCFFTFLRTVSFNLNIIYLLYISQVNIYHSGVKLALSKVRLLSNIPLHSEISHNFNVHF